MNKINNLNKAHTVRVHHYMEIRFCRTQFDAIIIVDKHFIAVSTRAVMLNTKKTGSDATHAFNHIIIAPRLPAYNNWRRLDFIMVLNSPD